MRLKDLSVHEIKCFKYACVKFILNYKGDNGEEYSEYATVLNSIFLNKFKEKFDIDDLNMDIIDCINFVSKRDCISVEDIDSYSETLFDLVVNDKFIFIPEVLNSITFQVADEEIASKLGLINPLFINIYTREEFEKLFQDTKNFTICNFTIKNSKKDYVLSFS